MIDFCRPYCLANFNRMRSRSLLVGALSTVSLVTGLVLDTSLGFSFPVLGTAAYAQEFGDPEVTKYAKAVLEAEPLRQTALNNIKQMMPAGEVPQIACYKKDTLNSLPENARDIVLNYCIQYENIVKKYFDSVEEFNQITKNVPSNPNLKKRIQEELLRLQNNPESK